MKKPLVAALLTVSLIGLPACSKSVSASELKSDKPRVTAPAVNLADMASLANGNSAFALDLYQALKSADGNFFYSPYSISEALAMTWGGARTDTEKQMADTLHFDLPQDRLHPAFNSLDLELAKRGEKAQGQDGEGFRLNVVNAIWGQKDFTFSQSYLDLLAQNYGAGLRLADFINASEPSRQTINQWVSDQTEGKIKDLIPKGAINDLTRMVLTNAIYFNAAWRSPFNKTATADGEFHTLTGNAVTVPFMKQSATFGYAEGENFQAVEIPYDGNELSMVILLPESEKFNAFESTLDSQRVNDIIGSIKYQTVVLTMPKFNFESSFGLKKTLSEMGMPVAFSPNADFSGIDGKKDLLIQDVVHKSFISVDEAGTEAAAATGVIVGTTGMPVSPAECTLDHPFIFLIRDISTGTVLFVGRVSNPAL